MKAGMKEIGRLAMRHEGNLWNAYYALPNTMDGALLIGSIAMAAVTENKRRKDAFMKMMSDFVADILQEKVGVRPDMSDVHAAPEHEKAGHS